MTTSKVKQNICRELIEKGLVREFDIVMHSRIKGRTLDMIVSDENNICPALTTRPDVLGVVVNELKIETNFRKK